jgi:hypothetical protein
VVKQKLGKRGVQPASQPATSANPLRLLSVELRKDKLMHSN